MFVATTRPDLRTLHHRWLMLAFNLSGRLICTRTGPIWDRIVIGNTGTTDGALRV